jgi:hypothetical protein
MTVTAELQEPVPRLTPRHVMAALLVGEAIASSVSTGPAQYRRKPSRIGAAVGAALGAAVGKMHTQQQQERISKNNKTQKDEQLQCPACDEPIKGAIMTKFRGSIRSSSCIVAGGVWLPAGARQIPPQQEPRLRANDMQNRGKRISTAAPYQHNSKTNTTTKCI